MTPVEKDYWQACIDARKGLPVSVGLALRALIQEQQAVAAQKYQEYVWRLSK